MKVCNGCRVEKPKSEFNKNLGRKDGLQPWCRDCNKLRSRKYYQDNKEQHVLTIVSRKKLQIAQNVSRFQSLKKHCKCAVCDEKEPICLDFHHCGDKDDRISSGIHGNWSWTRVKVEILKCIVLCSNCHRKLHAGLVKVNDSMKFGVVYGDLINKFDNAPLATEEKPSPFKRKTVGSIPTRGTVPVV